MHYSFFFTVEPENDVDNPVVETIKLASGILREASPTQEWGVRLSTSTGNKTIYGIYSGNAGSAYYDDSSGSNTHVTTTQDSPS